MNVEMKKAEQWVCSETLRDVLIHVGIKLNFHFS